MNFKALLSARFISGALIGGAVVFALQVFGVGDMPFHWFWVLNVAGALVGGLIGRALGR